MPSLYAEIEINAPPNLVWEALMRKEDWCYWNTFLFDCDPSLRFALGQEVFLAMQRLEGDEDTDFQPVVTVMRPDMCLRWVSRIPGLRTEHTFELRETAPGRTRYLHRDTFSGVLATVFLPFIRQDERQGLRRMAFQLKRYVEQGGRRGLPDYGPGYRQGYGGNYSESDRPYDGGRYAKPRDELDYGGGSPPDYGSRSRRRRSPPPQRPPGDRYPQDRTPPRDYPPDYPPRDYPPKGYPRDYPRR